MKTSGSLAAACLAVALSPLGVARAQGPLAPPGAPAPTMKTLAQVEPRFAVSAAPVALSAPGSYFLTTNLSGTVTIATNHVTLDLMGFAIVASSGNALVLSGALRNVRVHNGLVSAPAGVGVNFVTSVSNANGVIENVRVCACLSHGIHVGGGFEVSGCRVYGAAGSGIYVAGNSSVRDCTVEGCGTGLKLSGKGALLENNVVRQNADNYYLSAGNQVSLLLCELPETLNVPCSVRFAGTLALAAAGNGIQVQADHVAIDLGGHALVGPGTASGHGIHQDMPWRGLTVRNGKVAGWCGAGKGGLCLLGASSRVADVQAQTNFDGIVTGQAGVISGCSSDGNGHDGFRLGMGNAVSGCAANGNGAHGFEVGWDSLLSGCAASYNASNGFDAAYQGHVSTCVSIYNLGSGFRGGMEAVFLECSAGYNTGDGFLVGDGGVASRCSSCGNGNEGGVGAGFHVTGNYNRIEDNTAVANDSGFDVDGVGNLIVRNAATWNGVNWSVVSGNACLVVKATNTVSLISGDAGGKAIGPNDPFANFTYW